MKQKVNIVWFKKDLRTFDHEPLQVACAQSLPVIPLYIFEPDLWKQPDSSFRHWHFTHDCLVSLNQNLNKIGSKLFVIKGSVIEVFEFLKSKFDISGIFSHEETGNLWSFNRDKQVIKWSKNNSINFTEFNNAGVVRKLKSRDDWGRIRDARFEMPLFAAPNQISIPKDFYIFDLPKKDYLNSQIDLNVKVGKFNVQAGGREEGLKTLQSFLNDRSKKYLSTLSKPGLSARNCSRLSAHLTYGSLSVREVFNATTEKYNSLNLQPENDFIISHKKNLNAFISRLYWHCHFIQKLESDYTIEFKCMHPAFENMYSDNFNEAFFDAWKYGNTGYPLVDACMRSLHENGWLTFRMRAMVMSCASYQLGLDWRKTAPFLAGLFTDYEPGIHYSQVQMQSGTTGINTFRIYNVTKQSFDNDKDGKFIKRFIPELINVPTQYIHEPHLMPENLQKDLNIKIGVNYPAPIIDQNLAIKNARNQISQVLKSESYSEMANDVRFRLGSRGGANKFNNKKKLPNNINQLSLFS